MHKTVAGLAGTIALTTAALTASATLAAPAQAAPATQSWVMTSQTIGGVDRPIRIAASGPVSGAGVLTQDFEETESESGDVVHAVWHLPKGTVTADAFEEYALDFDPGSCTATATSSGTWVITGGTGAYAGATGHGSFAGHARIVGQRDHHGDCQGPDSDVDPRTAVATLKGTGTAELG